MRKIVTPPLIAILIIATLITAASLSQAYAAQPNRKMIAEVNKNEKRIQVKDKFEDRWMLQRDEREHRQLNMKLLLPEDSMLKIQAAGTAYKIRNLSVSSPASINLESKVVKSNRRLTILNITNGELKIGDEEYIVSKGKALISVYRFSVVGKATVEDSSGKTLHLMLRGKMTAPPPEPYNVGSKIPVVFTIPESKLVGHWFLSLAEGVLERIR